VIVSFAGRPVRNPAELRNRVAEAAVGQKVALEILRKGRRSSIALPSSGLGATERRLADVNRKVEKARKRPIKVS
jgi:S1-C subfamily serine protease